MNDSSAEAIKPSPFLARNPDGDLQLYLPGEAARLLRTTPDTLAQWRFRGRGPRVTMLNTSVRYRRSDLLAFIDSQSFNPAEGVPAHITRRKAGPGRPPGKRRGRHRRSDEMAEEAR